MTLSLFLLLACAPQTAGWTPLPLPSLCDATTDQPVARLLPEGRHVLLYLEEDDLATPEPAAELAPGMLGQMLEVEARLHAPGLELLPTVPPLVVTGDAAEVAWARGAVAALDAAGERLRIDVDAWLVPIAGAESLSAALTARRDGSHHWSGEVLSGEGLSLGRFERTGFLADYDIEVATDSGVAAPIMGRASHGRGVHLVATRVRSGSEVLLRGTLDVSQLTRIDDYDPGTPDLGLVQQPRVDYAQVRFAGVVASGERLRVELAGLPFGEPDWTLWVEARCVADESAAPAAGWRAIDIALLASEPSGLGPFAAGGGLEGAGELPATESTALGMSPSGITGLLRAERSGSSSAPRSSRGSTPVQWTRRLLLFPVGEESAWARARGLIAALEGPRLETRLVALSSGGLRVELPVVAGEPARVLVGSEQTWLVDYGAQIAPNSWMPAPQVTHTFDGLAWQAHLEGGRLSVHAFRAASAEPRRLDRDAAHMGALQLLARSLRDGDGSVSEEDARGLLLLDGPDPAQAVRTLLR